MNVPHDLTPSGSTSAAADVPEVNGIDTPNVKGPPEEKENKVGEPRSQKKTDPTKKDKERSNADKLTATSTDPRALKNGSTIWKTKPKT
jgi:hypothetical protein